MIAKNNNGKKKNNMVSIVKLVLEFFLHSLFTVHLGVNNNTIGLCSLNKIANRNIRSFLLEADARNLTSRTNSIASDSMSINCFFIELQF